MPVTIPLDESQLRVFCLKWKVEGMSNARTN
ncbi:MAG: hypothetical protein GHCLOJNM_02493 [bacterium]|nr:hypothetical protein [bacterium]